MQLLVELQQQHARLKTTGARTESISTGPGLVQIHLAQLRAIVACSLRSRSKYSRTAVGNVVQQQTCAVHKDFVQLDR